MLHLLSAIKGGGIVTGYLFLGGMATMLAQVVIGDGTAVQIGIVGALVVGVFYAGGTLQKIRDNIKTLMESKKETNDRLSRIEIRLGIMDRGHKESKSDE